MNIAGQNSIEAVEKTELYTWLQYLSHCKEEFIVANMKD